MPALQGLPSFISEALSPLNEFPFVLSQISSTLVISTCSSGAVTQLGWWSLYQIRAYQAPKRSQDTWCISRVTEARLPLASHSLHSGKCSRTCLSKWIVPLSGCALPFGFVRDQLKHFLRLELGDGWFIISVSFCAGADCNGQGGNRFCCVIPCGKHTPVAGGSAGRGTLSSAGSQVVLKHEKYCQRKLVCWRECCCADALYCELILNQI